MNQINTRGFSCPQPVIMAKNAIKDKPDELKVLVDSGAPKTNVTRFLKNSGYNVEIIEDDDGFVLSAVK